VQDLHGHALLGERVAADAHELALERVSRDQLGERDHHDSLPEVLTVPIPR